MTPHHQSNAKLHLLICLLFSHIFGLLDGSGVLPFEYLDERDGEFNNYDLDTVQSQAKYDARLLSQQMLSDAELLKQRADSESDLNSDTSQVQPAVAGGGAAGSAEEDLEPHSRAAACFTNGHKYTHGQKVPRLDACEVCLCMDGEIFCWWEKCDKANVNRVKGTRDGGAGGDGDGDYSDPYRYESTTRKSTKLHKTARKVGKRHKHHKNQKNFNDYEVYHSRKQKLGDYKMAGAIKQQQQQQQSQLEQQPKQRSDAANNYNIIKLHKHEQQLKLTTSSTQLELPVNQAAKEMHYQQSTPPPYPYTHPHPHPHPHPVHSSSKILNFPENLPALLYYDYKTEEHEHHQHQHHQQHLLHEKQRLQQQQREASLQKAAEVVDKNFDEAETDSDILPEPPTKRPKATIMPTAATATFTTTAAAATATTDMSLTRTNEMVTTLMSSLPYAPAATVATTNLQQERAGGGAEELDDAFHRWLTSTELNVENTNILDASFEQETPASTIIDDVAVVAVNKSDSSSSNSNNNLADAVFFRSSYNDYSSEFNGSVVNIDITLTAVDVHPHHQTDLIANGNRTTAASAAASAATTMGTVTTIAPEAHTSSNHHQQQQQQQQQLSTSLPPYTLTTIITTTPPATGRMCNVLGKLYKIGDILPQDTGNCLQCICTDAVTPDEMPSVTCSPHNCPPLVLPDLFDATGY